MRASLFLFVVIDFTPRAPSSKVRHLIMRALFLAAKSRASLVLGWICSTSSEPFACCKYILADFVADTGLPCSILPFLPLRREDAGEEAVLLQAVLVGVDPAISEVS